jgi:UDP-4-amino-4,6-dideoxy-N-acetyl-beta-L-altrosamine transaminase
MIPYGRQEITKDDVESVIEVLRSDFLTQGPTVPRFEKTVATKVRAMFAVAVNSATSALHVACLSLGLGPGDYLWTTPITFVASANCGIYCGAGVDFVDIDQSTYNIDVSALEHKLVNAERAGRLPKIVVVVHMCGQPSDMCRISELSHRFGFRVIEDASHAIGATYQNEPVGACRYSDITIFSFHPVKIVTTGEGGMAVTNSEELAERMRLLRSHGITRDQDRMTKLPDGPWYYQQVDLGFNFRMTDIQAALGISQMARLDDYVQRRSEIATRYDELLAHLPVRVSVRNPDATSAWHLYVIRLNLSEISKSRLEVFNALHSRGIGVNVHYIPVHSQPYYQQFAFQKGDFPHAETYYDEALSLPMYATLTDQQQDIVLRSLKEVLS